MISARRGAGIRRHLAKAAFAAPTAASTSALPDLWKMPTTSRMSAGLQFSKVSPVDASTHSPSIKFLYTLVRVAVPVMVGPVKRSVAIKPPGNTKKGAREELTISMLQAGVMGGKLRPDSGGDSRPRLSGAAKLRSWDVPIE